MQSYSINIDGYYEGKYEEWYGPIKDNTRYRLLFHRRGKLEGPSRYWYSSGDKSADVIYHNNNLVSQRIYRPNIY